MSSGLDNIIKPIEVDTDNWVNYKGTYIKYEDMTSGQKAWIARWKDNKNEKKIKSDKDKYDTNEKENQRVIVAELLNKVCKEWKRDGKFYSKTPLAVILESPELFLIKKLFPEFYSLKQDTDYEVPVDIIIPNKTDFDKFPTTQGWYYYYAHHLKLSEDSRNINYIVGIKPMTYLEFINEYAENYGSEKDRQNCCLIWADYCGAFSGYKEDIKRTFESKILGDNSYYILTFCTRDPAKKKASSSKINCIVDVTDFVTSCAKQNEYAVELMAKETGLYKSKMYTCFFHVYTDQVEVHRKKLNGLIENLQNYENIKAEIESEFKIIENLLKKKTM